MSEQSYEDSTLAKLSNAFESTWDALQADELPDGFEEQEELRRFVSEKLLALAAAGVTDPQKLRKQVLESLGKNGPAETGRTLSDRLRLGIWKGLRTRPESELRG